MDLNELNNGLYGISPELASAQAQAAGVCLDSQGHPQGVLLRVTGHLNHSCALQWPPLDDRARSTWKDLQEATEHGATAIAVLLTKQQLGLSVIQRSVKGTGFDYWLGEEVEGFPIQSKARLEVSGILRALTNSKSAKSVVAQRVREKIRQTERSSGRLPAYVIVVEFGSPLCQVQKV